MEHTHLETRPDKGPPHSAAGRRDAPGDVALLAAAPHRTARRTAGRGHGRNARVQRFELPHLRVLRPGEGGREPPRLLARARTGSSSCDGRVGDAGLDALGDHAGTFWRHRGHLAAGVEPRTKGWA